MKANINLNTNIDVKNTNIGVRISSHSCTLLRRHGMKGKSMIRNLAAIALLFSCSMVSGLDTAEFWAGQNKDGNGVNSNARSVQGNLRVRCVVGAGR